MLTRDAVPFKSQIVRFAFFRIFVQVERLFVALHTVIDRFGIGQVVVIGNEYFFIRSQSFVRFARFVDSVFAILGVNYGIGNSVDQSDNVVHGDTDETDLLKPEYTFDGTARINVVVRKNLRFRCDLIVVLHAQTADFGVYAPTDRHGIAFRGNRLDFLCDHSACRSARRIRAVTPNTVTVIIFGRSAGRRDRATVDKNTVVVGIKTYGVESRRAARRRDRRRVKR